VDSKKTTGEMGKMCLHIKKKKSSSSLSKNMLSSVFLPQSSFLSLHSCAKFLARIIVNKNHFFHSVNPEIMHQNV
jgi:hypothetical protein